MKGGLDLDVKITLSLVLFAETFPTKRGLCVSVISAKESGIANQNTGFGIAHNVILCTILLVIVILKLVCGKEHGWLTHQYFWEPDLPSQAVFSGRTPS